MFIFAPMFQQAITQRIWQFSIISLMILVPQLLPAQGKPSIDQLLKKLETAKPDTNKVNLLNSIAESYLYTDHQNSLLYINQQLELAEKLDWVTGRVKAYYQLGNAHFISSELQKSLEFYQKGYDLAQNNKLAFYQYSIMTDMAEVNRYLKNPDLALEYSKTAVQYFQQSKDVIKSGSGTSPMWVKPAVVAAYVFAGQKKDTAANIYFQQQLDKYMLLKDTLGIRTSLSLFIMYNRNIKKNYPAALVYALKELSTHKKADPSIRHSYSIITIADLYTQQKNYVKALEYYRAVVALTPKTDPYVKYNVNSGMHNIYTVLGDYNRALQIDLEQLQIVQNLDDYKSMILYHYRNAGNDYKHLKRYDQALVQLKKSLQISEKMNEPDTKSVLMGDLAHVYFLMQNYDESIAIINESLKLEKASLGYKKLNALYLGMSIRDAPDNVLQKHGIPPSERYAQAVKNLETSLTYAKPAKNEEILQLAYKELSTTYMLMKDYKGFAETYPLYISMRDSSVNRENQNAFLNRISEIQFKNREDSLHYQQRLTEEQLGQQILLATQQRQDLLLNRQEFSLLAQEKDLQALRYQKTQSDLQGEQNKRVANEQQLKAAQKEQALQRVELTARRTQNYYLIGGIAALLALSFFIARNYFNQRRSNGLLTTANRQITTEKQRSDSLLLNILPADVAEELKEKGSANARLFDHVTVLFTDFVNFTSTSELLTPQELVDELHTCFKAFDEIISGFGIEKIKTIGDAYLAVAGLPNTDTDHAHKIVQAALKIRQFVHDRKSLLGSRSFDIRIGIHSGSVVAGIVGVKKFAYDIWGDTVNTAARMEQNSLPGQINLSEKTYELVKDQFAFTYRGEIDAKNKGAMKMYFVEKRSMPMMVSS